jgi:ATP-dependent RNA helicase DDX31/DBP7
VAWCCKQAVQPRLTRAQGTCGIVVAPTRELCIQITDVLGLILRRFIWLVRALTSTPAFGLITAAELCLMAFVCTIHRRHRS